MITMVTMLVMKLLIDKNLGDDVDFDLATHSPQHILRRSLVHLDS